MEERERREKSAWRARRQANGVWISLAYRNSRFVANVWAARVLLEAEWGRGNATNSRIARWLINEEMQEHYAKSSVRQMVRLALKTIEDLESHGETEEDPPFWEAYKPDLLTGR